MPSKTLIKEWINKIIYFYLFSKAYLNNGIMHIAMFLLQHTLSIFLVRIFKIKYFF